MRAAWLVVVSLAIAVVAQLSVLNGLHLPGGGVPDLVLVLVAALAMAGGPVNGMIIGFAAGLCVDLAPPGSELVGQYALVFCLVGWAAGRLRPVPRLSARHSAGLVGTALLALVVGGAEVLSAVVGKLFAPAVTLGQIGRVLPWTIGYDWVLSPLVLSLVMLAGAMLAERSESASVASALAGTGRSRRAAKRAQRLPELRLGREARRLGSGWLSMSRPAARRGRRRARPAPVRLRPAAGVPGSASGLRHQHTGLPAGAPVHLRLGRGRPGDGVIGTGILGSVVPGTQHAVRRFRPHSGERAGSAARSYELKAPVPAGRQRGISFRAHRGDGSLRQGPATGRTAPRPPRPIHFSGHRGDGSLGHGLPTGSSAPRPSRRQARIRFGGHPPVPVTVRSTQVPRIAFASKPVPAPRRVPASPRFRHGSSLVRSAVPSSGVVGGGVLTDSALRARRMQASPRLNLSGTAPGMLGGTGLSTLRAKRPGRSRKQPRFSYGRRSPLRRAGSRSGVWLIGRRTGELR